MKIGFGLAAALAFAILSPSGAFAQNAGATSKVHQQGMAEAPAVLAAKGIACTLTDASYLGEATSKDAAGKSVKSKIYEVACSEGLGYVVGSNTEPYDCLILETAAAQAKKGSATTKCKLPANVDAKAGLGPLLAKAGVACTPAQGRWVGASPTSLINQYEVGCADGQAFLITSPMPNSTTKLSVDNCMRSPESCKFYSKDAAMKAMGALAAQSKRTACQITDIRYVATKTAGGDFYEVGCADGKSGYFLETDPKGAFKNSIECARAESIAGGCTLTTIAVTGSTEEAPAYTKGATAAGFKCNVSQYRSMGTDSEGRELAEVACTDRPDGAYVLIAISAGQKGAYYNCIRAEARGQSCKLSQKSAVFEKLKNQLANQGKQCQVAATRGIGQTADGNDVVEIQCAGGAPGFVVTFYKDSDGIGLVTPCASADKVGGCKLK